jgi:hypothetical protein
LPSIDALHDELRYRGLTVLLVDIAERPETVAATVKQRSYRLPVLLDADSRTTNAYHVIATPTVFLIGRDGALLGRAIGPRAWTTGAGRALLDALLKGPGARSHVGVGSPLGS